MTPAATCVCGHDREAHEHYRRGSDCALCDCPRFRRPGRIAGALRSALRGR